MGAVQSAQGRRIVLRRLSGTAHLPDFLKNVLRIFQAALQARRRYSRGLHLGGYEYAQRRGAGGKV